MDRIDDRVVVEQWRRRGALSRAADLVAQVVKVGGGIEIGFDERSDACQVRLGEGLNALDELDAGHFPVS